MGGLRKVGLLKIKNELLFMCENLKKLIINKFWKILSKFGENT